VAGDGGEVERLAGEGEGAVEGAVAVGDGAVVVEVAEVEVQGCGSFAVLRMTVAGVGSRCGVVRERL